MLLFILDPSLYKYLKEDEGLNELVKKRLEQVNIFNAACYLNNYEIKIYIFQKNIYFQNEPKFICFYWKNDLPKIDGAYLMNSDEHKSKGTHWKAL